MVPVPNVVSRQTKDNGNKERGFRVPPEGPRFKLPMSKVDNEGDMEFGFDGWMSFGLDGLIEQYRYQSEYTEEFREIGAFFLLY